VNPLPRDEARRIAANIAKRARIIGEWLQTEARFLA
jgi:hypothetical protein